VDPKLLLASNSPRRRDLLSEGGFQFETYRPNVTERFDVDLTLRELTAFNAIRKAMAAARAHSKKVVLAADTLVAIQDRVLGKPRDLAEAVTMLERLSGNIHEVCTSVFICHLAHGKSTSFSEISRVHFRHLTGDEINDYLDRVNPLDKAGAYAAQGFGSEIIEKIDGSFSNVVGLPMEITTSALVQFGIRAETESS
jgi:septum formation protein